MKKVCMLLVVALLAMQAPAFAQDLKIAVVNTAYVYAKSLAGQSGENQVKQKTSQLMQEIEKSQTAFKSMVDDFQRQQSALSLENRRLKELELKRKQNELKELAAAYRQADQAARKELLPPVNRFLETHASEYLKAQGYTLVIDATRGALAFYDKEFDVSDAVLAYCDDQWKAKGN